MIPMILHQVNNYLKEKNVNCIIIKANIHHDLDFNDQLVLNQISKECPFKFSSYLEDDLLINKDTSLVDINNEEKLSIGEVAVLKRKSSSIIRHLENNYRKSYENTINL